MTRLTAGMMKGTTRQALQQEPRPGTKIKAVYDLFINHPAIPIHINQINAIIGKRYSMVREILLEYGLDIRNYSHGYWWIVGKYNEDDTYTDYIADKMD